MNTAFSFALVAAVASAQTFTSTSNECWLGQGGQWFDNCSDVYFFTCDIYEVNKGDACNVYIFSDSRVTWFSQDIIAHFTEYYRRPGVASKEPIDGARDMAGEERCYSVTDTAQQYENGLVMNYTGGMCGFKYQITNTNADYPNEFEVLKDGAATLFATSAIALAAALAF